ncbi:MAG: hypothetical protein JO168_15120 [Solirubrobacterales bacterium]|nr:hypothetical protein [Solirubrobacterales bacterium]
MALSKKNLEYRLATAGAVTNPELLLEYLRQVLEPATETSEPGQTAPKDSNEALEPTGTERAQRAATDPAHE